MNTFAISFNNANFLDPFLKSVDNNIEKKILLKARIMMLALPLFEAMAVCAGISKIFFSLTLCAIKIITAPLLLFVTTDSALFQLPGFSDLEKLVAKTALCALLIIFSPLWIFNPQHAITFHRKMGLTKLKQTELDAKADAAWEHLAKIIVAGGKIKLSTSTTAKPTPKPVDGVNSAYGIPAGNGFADIIGMEELKEEMQSAIDMLKFPALAHKFKLTTPSGLLLKGVPGVGKTFFAQKFTEEAALQLKKNITFHEFTMAKTSSKYIHETSKIIGEMFDKAAKSAAENKTFSVLFIDEIDTVIKPPAHGATGSISVYAEEERGTFLQQLQMAAEKNVLVIATTNHPENLDDAIVRSGRFDIHFEIPLPNKSTISQILKKKLKDATEGISDESLDQLAEALQGWNISDVKTLCELANRKAFEMNVKAQIVEPGAPTKLIHKATLEAAVKQMIAKKTTSSKPVK